MKLGSLVYFVNVSKVTKGTIASRRDDDGYVLHVGGVKFKDSVPKEAVFPHTKKGYAAACVYQAACFEKAAESAMNMARRRMDEAFWEVSRAERFKIAASEWRSKAEKAVAKETKKPR